MANEYLERGETKARANSNSSGYYANQYSVDNSERLWTSWLVPSIVVANIAAFIVLMYVNNCPKNNNGLYGDCVAKFLGRLSFQPLKENPLFGPSSSKLEKMGELEWHKVVHEHQGWRLISSVWLHAGVSHLLANMLSLVFIGIRLEQEFGFVRVGLIYLLSGFGGNILSALFLQNSISVGASGALFGLLGAMLSELLINWTIYSNKAAALLTLVFIIILNLAIGILPHVDNFVHIGGLLTGFLLGFIFLLRPQYGWIENQSTRLTQYVMCFVSLVLLIVGLFVTSFFFALCLSGMGCSKDIALGNLFGVILCYIGLKPWLFFYFYFRFCCFSSLFFLYLCSFFGKNEFGEIL